MNAPQDSPGHAVLEAWAHKNKGTNAAFMDFAHSADKWRSNVGCGAAPAWHKACASCSSWWLCVSLVAPPGALQWYLLRVNNTFSASHVHTRTGDTDVRVCNVAQCE